MKIKVNNKEVETESTNLHQLAEELRLPEKGVAIAVDKEMISRTEWQGFTLKNNQDIIIIKAVCGG